MSILTADILHVVYEHLEHHIGGPQSTLHKVLQVSRLFHAVFRHYLYRDLLVDIENPRLSILIKTLKANPNLKNAIQSLKIRLSIGTPNPTSLRHRYFPPTNHFVRFVQFIVDAPPTNLNALVVFSPRSVPEIGWMELAESTRNALWELRCKLPFRVLRLECITSLRPAMIWGRPGLSSPLDELHLFRIVMRQDKGVQFATSQSCVVRSLSVRPALVVLRDGVVFRGLESIRIDQPPIPYDHLVKQSYAVVAGSSETLRYLHLQAIHQSWELLVGAFGALAMPNPPVLRLDLQKHTKLETLVISQDPPFRNPYADPDDGVYEVTELNREFLVCLRSIDLPPTLRMLKVRMYLPEVSSPSEPMPQNRLAEEGLEPGWHWRSPTLDCELVNLVRRSAGIQRLEVCLIPFPGVKVPKDGLLEFEALFPLTKEGMGGAFTVYLDGQPQAV